MKIRVAPNPGHGGDLVPDLGQRFGIARRVSEAS
jgi:hypothetical protein